MEKKENLLYKKRFYLILGPPNSGKTSLIYRLYSGIFYNEIQVVHRDLEEVKVDQVHLRSLNIWENNLTNEVWELSAVGCEGLIFIIDVSSQTSINEGKEFLLDIVQPSYIFQKVPKVVFGNKVDLSSYSETILLEDLELSSKQNSYFIQCISCKTTEGILEGMAWLMEKANLFFYIPKFRK